MSFHLRRLPIIDAPAISWIPVPAMNRCAFVVLASLLGLVLGAGTALAAPKAAQQYYRYKNAQGHLVIERSIPPEYVGKGYQIVTLSGQVIQDVPPAETGKAEEARKQSEDAARNIKLDNQLRKLYGSPQDAVRHRDRQIEALKLKVDFAKGQLLQLNGKRKIELDQAARLERSGKKVPDQARASLDTLDRRIANQEADVNTSEAEIQRLREDFVLTIDRLNLIYPAKAIPRESYVSAAAPAAATDPAAHAPLQGR